MTPNNNIKVGVLGIQGAYLKHAAMIKSLGADAVIVKYAEQLQEIQGLILPGGESTTITKVMGYRLNFEDILDFGKTNPIFGTCAGLILLGNHASDPRVTQFNLLNVSVERNAYGSQINSFTDDIELSFSPEKPFHAVYIRAPRIQSVAEDISILATQNSQPVLVENTLHLGATFHPELTNDPRVHQYFLNKIHEVKHDNIKSAQ